MDLVFHQKSITIWWLEMDSVDQLRPSKSTAMVVDELELPTTEQMRSLWFRVGGPWSWIGRLGWDEARWRQQAGDRSVHTYVGYVDEQSVGYYELNQHANHVEIKCFGLFPEAIGNGYGGHLLTDAVQRAWALGTVRVIVDTCSKDSPAALKNYLSRGFAQYDERTEMQQVPEPF